MADLWLALTRSEAISVLHCWTASRRVSPRISLRFESLQEAAGRRSKWIHWRVTQPEIDWINTQPALGWLQSRVRKQASG